MHISDRMLKFKRNTWKWVYNILVNMDRMHVAIVELSYLLKSRVGGYDQKINLLTCDKTYIKFTGQYLLGQSSMEWARYQDSGL